EPRRHALEGLHLAARLAGGLDGDGERHAIVVESELRLDVRDGNLVTERDRLPGVLDGTDRADARGREDVTLLDPVVGDRRDRRLLEVDRPAGDRSARAVGFRAHVDHLCVALGRGVGQIVRVARVVAHRSASIAFGIPSSSSEASSPLLENCSAARPLTYGATLAAANGSRVASNAAVIPASTSPVPPTVIPVVPVREIRVRSPSVITSSFAFASPTLPRSA